jgi:membrane protease YdiL (CAAX protease family)
LWPAIIVSSVGFMAHHVIVLSVYFGWFSPASVFFSLAVAVGGATWAWIYYRSGSLVGPWASHLLVDVGIFVVGFDLVRPLLTL